MSRRRTHLLISFLAIVSGFAVAPNGHAADKSSRPNILFIYTDDHSYRTVSCYPEELTNLALDRDFAGKLTEMRAATIAELKRTNAGMADNLPPVKFAF